MKLLILVYLAQVAWPVYGVYYTESIELFEPPSKVRNDSFFGYSITYDQQFKKLVVSAPRENGIGTVYDCNIDNKVCSPIIQKEIKRSHSNYSHDYWFGATVKSGPDFVVMCAPRSMAYINFVIPSYVTFGTCLLHKNGKIERLQTIPPSKRSGDDLEDHMDSFGWSIDVTPDKSIIIGGPGMNHGRAMLLKPGKGAEALRPTISPEFNFGYAVSAGHFIRKSTEKDSLAYAVSTTYGKDGSGEVLFFRGPTQQSKLNKKEDVAKVGSMFGAVLCAAHLSGANKNDLLVGAPTYGSATESEYNLGAVYIYKANRKNNPPTFEKKIVGEESGAQFGSAIISLGDLNGDGKDEIAISAPFEDSGRGAVYIYSGHVLVTKTDKTVEYLQKILPEDSYANSFGMSLTTLSDYDNNGCNELAIGSPFTNKVLLLRCMASIYVTTEVIFPYLQGRTKAGRTNFELDVCINVTYPKLPEKVIAELATTVEMLHDDASLLATTPKGFVIKTVSVTIPHPPLQEKKPSYCTKVPFILPLTGAYHNEIVVTTKTALLSDPRTLPTFDSSRVILSDRSMLATRNSFWAAECAGKMCVPILAVTPKVSFQYPDHKYTIGQSLYEHIEISVLNTGEVAYDMCLHVFIYDVPVFETPGNCHLQPKVSDLYAEVKCSPPIPLQTGQDWTTGQIKLEMNHLNNLDTNVTIKIQKFNYCGKPENEETTIVTDMVPDVFGPVVKGETDIGMFVNITQEDVDSNGKKFQHIFTIVNIGVTNYAPFEVQVTLPKQPYLSYDEIFMIVSLTRTQVSCTRISDDDTESKYLCTLEDLVGMNKTQAKVVVPINILSGTLGNRLEDNKNVTITSSIKLLLPDHSVYGSTETIIMLQEPEFPLMWIIIGVCVGLFFIIIIAIVLYKIGFLRRKKKEELINLRKSVRRQTILRRSTMPTRGRPSVSGPSDADKLVLETTKEDDEEEQSKPST
ncbi:integrin alpha-4 [Helicoverpa armigera]|uniref:integrin alpha-4 n=1 Tax=Helicoverpa armigera TaxID=29058 RepID=UPI0030832F78